MGKVFAVVVMGTNTLPLSYDQPPAGLRGAELASRRAECDLWMQAYLGVWQQFRTLQAQQRAAEAPQ